MKRMSHANCTHDNTTAARAKCRGEAYFRANPYASDRYADVTPAPAAETRTNPRDALTQRVEAAIAAMSAHVGVCMTCLNSAEATFSNEGYSDCCNDRITNSVTEVRQLLANDIAALDIND